MTDYTTMDIARPFLYANAGVLLATLIWMASPLVGYRPIGIVIGETRYAWGKGGYSVQDAKTLRTRGGGLWPWYRPRPYQAPPAEPAPPSIMVPADAPTYPDRYAARGEEPWPAPLPEGMTDWRNATEEEILVDIRKALNIAGPGIPEATTWKCMVDGGACPGDCAKDAGIDDHPCPKGRLLLLTSDKPKPSSELAKPTRTGHPAVFLVAAGAPSYLDRYASGELSIPDTEHGRMIIQALEQRDQIIYPAGIAICAALGISPCTLLYAMGLSLQAKEPGHRYHSVDVCHIGEPCDIKPGQECVKIGRSLDSTEKAWIEWVLCRKVPTS